MALSLLPWCSYNLEFVEVEDREHTSNIGIRAKNWGWGEGGIRECCYFAIEAALQELHHRSVNTLVIILLVLLD